jgi:hypothetical protein
MKKIIQITESQLRKVIMEMINEQTIKRGLGGDEYSTEENPIFHKGQKPTPINPPKLRGLGGDEYSTEENPIFHKDQKPTPINPPKLKGIANDVDLSYDMKKLAPGENEIVAGTALIKYGMKGPVVKKLQDLLKLRGATVSNQGESDGIFGKMTLEGVKLYQSKKRIKARRRCR